MEIDTGAFKLKTENEYIQNVRLTLLRINEWIRTTADDLCIPLIDLYPLFVDPDNNVKLRDDLSIGDNAHLNVKGQQLIAKALYDGYFDCAEGLSQIVCLGDSHTQGHPMRIDISRNGIPIDRRIDPPNNFPFFLHDLTGKSVINRGIAGNTVMGMLNRFDTEVIPHLPDHCTVLGGTNDVLIGIHLEETIEDLEKLYRRCMDSNIVPVACTIIPLGI